MDFSILLDKVLSQEIRIEHFADMVKEHNYYQEVIQQPYSMHFYKVYYDYIFDMENEFDINIHWAHIRQTSKTNIQQWLAHSSHWLSNKSDDVKHLGEMLIDLFQRKPKDVEFIPYIKDSQKAAFISLAQEWSLSLTCSKKIHELFGDPINNYLVYYALKEPHQCANDIIKLYKEQSDVILLKWHILTGIPITEALLEYWEEYGYHYIQTLQEYVPRHIHWSHVNGFDLTTLISRPELKGVILPPAISLEDMHMYKNMGVYQNTPCVQLYFHDIYSRILSQECDILV